MTAIQFTDVSRHFGDVVAIENLSFSVGDGEYVTVLGRSGCGKSTTLGLVLGLIGASGGRVDVLGVDPHRDFAALRGKIGCVFQDDRLLPWRTALDNVTLPLEIAGVRTRDRLNRATSWLDRLGLSGFREAYPGMLSGGMRQRVAIARALVADPPILLADEAFSSLDIATGRALRADLRAIAKASGKTVLHITHSIDEAIEVSDRILVFGKPGRLLAEHRDIAGAAASRKAALRRSITGTIENLEPITVAAAE